MPDTNFCGQTKLSYQCRLLGKALGVRLPKAASKHMCEITVATINLTFPCVPVLDFPHRKLNNFPSFLWDVRKQDLIRKSPSVLKAPITSSAQTPPGLQWHLSNSKTCRTQLLFPRASRMLCPSFLLWSIPIQDCPLLQIHCS